MKLKLLAVAVIGLTLQATQAAVTVTIANLKLTAPTGSLLVTNDAGVVYAGGSWAVGNFDPGTSFNSTAGELFANWNQNGTNVGFATTAGVFGALAGPNPTGVATSIDGSDPFTGTNVYLMIGNAGTLAGSTDYIVIQMPNLWTQEIEGAGGTVSGFAFDGTVLRGTSTIVSGATGAAAQFNGQSGVTFGAVPEPSVALLGALGLLGLVRRRR